MSIWWQCTITNYLEEVGHHYYYQLLLYTYNAGHLHQNKIASQYIISIALQA